MEITCIKNDGQGTSEFGVKDIELAGATTRMLSEQIPALNFRLRTSDKHYASDWHVAGDPTLLVVLNGIIRIELRSGLTRDFSAGELFIAQDYLRQDTEFDNTIHGHRALVIGEESISVLHLKLAKIDQ